MMQNCEQLYRGRFRWGMGLLIGLIIGILILTLRPVPLTRAKTDYLAAAHAQYPALVGTRIDNCTLCHHTDATRWPGLNPYGLAFQSNGFNFTAVANLDSDGDGATNLAEIDARAFPGDPNDRPVTHPYSTYLPLIHKSLSTSNGQYVLIGWNDLGMHCMDPTYEDFSVLPPFNTLWAQVIKRGSEPRIVTTGVSVEYQIIDNTYSAGKTNFWDYSQKLFSIAPFNLTKPLPPNIGLKGFGLSGQMHLAGDHFAAEGIPLTEYRDSNLAASYPYQVAQLVAKNNSGQVIASTQTVAPVSTEMNCQNCHNDSGSANPAIATGKVKQNILTLHDQNQHTTLMNERPVLCARCHSSNALGTVGTAGVSNLSRAMHNQHQSVTNDCYQCHPGPQTQCLRDVMYQKGLTCQSCHGNMSDVANPARQPWLSEPRCGSCHGTSHSEDPGKLYRFSTGHGGVYCQACHGSQHAIYPTLQPNDNIQSTLLQGYPGTINKCTVCHTNNPEAGEGPHQGDDD